MDLVSFLLTLLTTFLGLSFGIALAYIAKEELGQGKRVFMVLQVILAIAVIVFVFIDINRDFIMPALIFLFGFPSGSLIMYEKFKTERISSKTYIIYSAIYISFIIILSILKLL